MFCFCSVLVNMGISSICFYDRLGVIEEEREEDERKLGVAIAAAERMNVLVRRKKTQLLSGDEVRDYPNVRYVLSYFEKLLHN